MSANLTINKKAEGGNEEQADGMCKFSSLDLENRKGVLMQTLIIKICCWQDFQLDTIHIKAKDRSYSN